LTLRRAGVFFEARSAPERPSDFVTFAIAARAAIPPQRIAPSSALGRPQ